MYQCVHALCSQVSVPPTEPTTLHVSTRQMCKPDVSALRGKGYRQTCCICQFSYYRSGHSLNHQQDRKCLSDVSLLSQIQTHNLLFESDSHQGLILYCWIPSQLLRWRRIFRLKVVSCVQNMSGGTAGRKMP